MRITELPASAHSFSLAALASMRAYAYCLGGNPDRGLEFPNPAVSHTIMDPSSGALLTAAAEIVRGNWDLAHRIVSAVLERIDMRDHIGLKRLALSMYAVISAAREDTAAAVAAIREVDATPAGRSALYESMMGYWLIVAGTAVRFPDMSDRIAAYLHTCTDAGEWFMVMRMAHFAALHSEGEDRARHLACMRTAAEFVDTDIAGLFCRDADALVAEDAALRATTRAALASFGIWMPQRQVELTLSARQREIAGLVAGGLTNKEIAQRLFVSVRTVESHVAAVLAKFGVSDRRQLATKLAMLDH